MPTVWHNSLKNTLSIYSFISIYERETERERSEEKYASNICHHLFLGSRTWRKVRTGKARHSLLLNQTNKQKPVYRTRFVHTFNKYALLLWFWQEKSKKRKLLSRLWSVSGLSISTHFVLPKMGFSLGAPSTRKYDEFEFYSELNIVN